MIYSGDIMTTLEIVVHIHSNISIEVVDKIRNDVINLLQSFNDVNRISYDLNDVCIIKRSE